nr:hypothetical protein [Escherichia coli]
MSDNNEVTHPFDVTNTETGKTYQLSPNSSKSVQPIALLRLSVFLPRWELKRSDTEIFEVDASDELSSMELARSEGYDDIRITGLKLSMSTDF